MKAAGRMLKMLRMKKNVIMLLAALMVLCQAGCTVPFRIGQSEDEEASFDYTGQYDMDTLIFEKDGHLTEIAVDDYSSENFEYGDLEQYIKNSIDQFNLRESSKKITFLQYSDDNGIIRSAIRYSNVDAYNKFNNFESEFSLYDAEKINEKYSSGELYVVATFTDATGSDALSTDISQPGLMMYMTDEAISFKVDGGKILYVKNGTFSDDGSVVTNGRGQAIIVFSLGY